MELQKIDFKKYENFSGIPAKEINIVYNLCQATIFAIQAGSDDAYNQLNAIYNNYKNKNIECSWIKELLNSNKIKDVKVRAQEELNILNTCSYLLNEIKLSCLNS